MDPASTSFILGYHGCDQDVAEGVLAGIKGLTPSTNDHDWLGDGIYFWEHNALRAYQFACEVRDGKRGPRKVKTPAVIGAIIDIGTCLNLLDSRYIGMVASAHSDLVKLSAEAGTPLPRNSFGKDMLLRNLDCAVIRFLHTTRLDREEDPFDSVRAAFVEGEPLYENAGFHSKNHIQICVRNVECIKGYFRPLNEKGVSLRFRKGRSGSGAAIP